ncbi:MAG: 4Fe-4S single cluster domain-containing protein [Bacteroidota bacterium]
MQLILNRIQWPVYNLGPGKRMGLWVQGCSLGCKGCINPALWTQEQGQAVPIPQLVHAIASQEDAIEGITISGGEPFEQYPALMAFCAFLKKRTSLNIYVFSGYRLEELLDKYPDQIFLKYVDFLMDGRYEGENHDDQNVRGSLNQQLYEIKAGVARPIPPFPTSSKWSLKVEDDQTVFMSGIPRKGELQKIRQALAAQGINLKPQ